MNEHVNKDTGNAKNIRREEHVCMDSEKERKGHGDYTRVRIKDAISCWGICAQSPEMRR